MAAVLLLLLIAGVVRGELTRREEGDVFTINATECGPLSCAEHGARSDDGCACVCPQRAPLFREDRELCVDDLPECALASFGTGSGVQRIPFVYLPLKGQIIHPSREITFHDVKTPICAVSGAQFLTRKGFLDLRNTLDADVPFSLFRDEGRTFLQWAGEDDVRTAMSGRVVVVRLLCRDVSSPPAAPLDLRGVFTPCVAFRVQGTPPKHNVSEVQFQRPNAQISQESSSSNLSVSEYVAIGISSLLLGLIYVASVLLYLHIRKRKRATSEESSTRKFKGLKNKDGSIITERDIIRISNERVQSLSSIGEEDGIVKSNPLLSIGKDYHDSKGEFPSDSGSNLSDSEDICDSSGRSDDTMYHHQKTSATIHLHHGVRESREEGLERLPDEHVSIVESRDDLHARPVGNARRKLYFNPAYFEPQLMAEPPPAALEFLTKIREVITIAKHKMAAKRFQPILNQIPEEDSYPSTRNSVDLYQGSQRSGSVISLKRENSRKKSCPGCPGCKSDSSTDINNLRKFEIPSCTNCKSKGDKQNSIRKWLENIPTGKQQLFYNDFANNQSSLVNSLQLLPNENRCKIKKQHSFSNSSPMYLTDNFSVSKKAATLSVRSEPGLRSYNLPLPEFNDKQNPNYNNYCPTVSRVEDIRPIGLRESHSGSFRGNHIMNVRKNKFITNKNALPDMVNEAIALDHCAKVYNQSSSDDERFNNSSNGANKLPYKRNTDSPVCNDYETDSLERTSNKKGKLTPSDYDVPSSQASPSLSAALPLEEELTMTNAVYKSQSTTPSPQRELHNHYEVISNVKNKTTEKTQNKIDDNPKTDYSLVSEVYVNNFNFGSAPTSPSGSECSMGSRKLKQQLENNVVEKPGCLTIEVKDPPENYIKIHESDGFEPDTLDRKHQKQKAIVDNIQFSRKDLLKNIGDNGNNSVNRIQLRSSGTFTRTDTKVEYAAKFNSLRNDYELRSTYERPRLSPTTFNETSSKGNDTDDTWNSNIEWDTEEGRILTLELRHSKRQRQSTPPTIKQIKNLARPDVLPPLPPTDENSIYEQPACPPRRVGSARVTLDNPKNLNGRSLSPRTSTNHTTEPTSLQDFTNHAEHVSSKLAARASVYSKSTEYENIDTNHIILKRNPSKQSNSSINTNTFVKNKKDDIKSRQRRKKGSIEDSGYLSSDSTGSRQVLRKVVIAKIVSSESDDTETEARSESGAESVETHSVYFGSYNNPQIKSARSSRKNRTIRDRNKNS